MCHIQSWFKTVYVTSETVNGVSEHILHRLLCKGPKPPLILLCVAREIENRWNAVNKAKVFENQYLVWPPLFFDTSWTLFLKVSGHVRTDSLLDSHPQVVTKRTADKSYRYNSSLKFFNDLKLILNFLFFSQKEKQTPCSMSHLDTSKFLLCKLLFLMSYNIWNICCVTVLMHLGPDTKTQQKCKWIVK